MTDHAAVLWLQTAHQHASYIASQALRLPHDLAPVTSEDPLVQRAMRAAQMQIPATHPGTVLGRVGAEREILAEHSDDHGDCTVCAGPESFDDDYEGNRIWSRSAQAWPCRTVLLLAKAWGWEAET